MICLIIGLPYCLRKQFYSIHINFNWQQRGIILCSVHPSTQPPHTHPLRCDSFILCFLVVCAKTSSFLGPFPENNRTPRIPTVLEFWSLTGWVQKLAWTFHIGQITGLLGAFKSWSKGKGYANFQFAAIMNIRGSHLHAMVTTEPDAHRADTLPSVLAWSCWLSSLRL